MSEATKRETTKSRLDGTTPNHNGSLVSAILFIA